MDFIISFIEIVARYCLYDYSKLCVVWILNKINYLDHKKDEHHINLLLFIQKHRMVEIITS